MKLTTSPPPPHIMQLYRAISERLADPSMRARLKSLFTQDSTVPQLLEWVHARLRFTKEGILRHNDPFKIIEYGRGMCREFSVLFTAACLANGYRARIILDLSDHAWTEVWNAEERRWVHVDPSEKRIDDPEMYERDWKKNLRSVYAFENGVMEEVTSTYKMKRSTRL